MCKNHSPYFYRTSSVEVMSSIFCLFKIFRAVVLCEIHAACCVQFRYPQWVFGRTSNKLYDKI